MSRRKVEWRSDQKTNYKDFKEKHPTLDVSYDNWLFILRSFNESMRDYVIETGDKLRLPCGIGDISILKKKKKLFRKGKNGDEIINLPIDWKKTKEAGKRVFMMNHHTDGFSFAWIWFKNSSKLKQPVLWKFNIGRVGSRLLAYYLKNDEKYQQIYKEWPSKY